MEKRNAVESHLKTAEKKVKQKKKKLETKQNKKEKQIIHLIHKNKEKVTKN